MDRYFYILYAWMQKYIMCIGPISNRLKEVPNMPQSLMLTAIHNFHSPSIENGDVCIICCSRGQRLSSISSKMSNTRLYRKLCQLLLVIALMGAPQLGSAQSFGK